MPMPDDQPPLSRIASAQTALQPDLAGLSVLGLLAAQARAHGDALALSAMSGSGARQRLSYAGLNIAARQSAAALQRRGLTAGDRLGIFLTNDRALECFLAALGALTLGAVVVPLNTRFARDDLHHAIGLTGPRLIVADADGQAQLSRCLGVDVPAVLDADTVTRAPPPGPADEIRGLPDPDSLACLLFTSGTTARAKAVMHSHRTMIAAGRCSGAALGLRPGDVYQGAFPFFTSSALNLAAMSCWVAGAGLVIEGQIDTEARLSLIASEGTGFYHGVPSVLNFMVREYDRARHDLSGLHTIAYGGAAMPGELVARIGAIWPRARQVQIYGMTESGPAGTVLPPECKDDKPGSVGRVMPEMELAVLDDSGQPVPHGEAGEIALSGPSVGLGYFHDPDATARAFVGRRVLTGDVGRLDTDGFLFFEDRKKDLINRGGFKIASARVEQVLYRHPDVLEAAVIAIPHPDLGEDMAACVVLSAGSDTGSDRLEAFCREHLADNEVPRRFAVLEHLPKSPMGKVLKTELRAFWTRLQH